VVRARRTVSVLAAGTILGIFAGSALGVLWWRLAPRVPVLINEAEGPTPGYQPQEYIGADVAFGSLGLVAGLVITIGLVRMRRDQILSVLVASIVAGIIGSAAMWFVGTRLGSVDIEGLIATTTESITVDAPLVVTLPGVYLVWPLVAALIVTLVAFSDVWTARAWRSSQQSPPS
jgi:hypothetical protein